MRVRRMVIVGVLGLWGILAGASIAPGRAQEGEHADPAEQHATPAAEGAPADVHDHHQAEEPTLGEEQSGGHHHHHRPALLPPEEDKAYSEFNHHVAGVFVLAAGGLAFLAIVGGPRYSWARYGWAVLFFLLGAFLAVRHDPESWPLGPLTLWESVTDAQILQHVLFTFIVLGIGVIEWLRCRGVLAHPAWGWIFPSLAVSAAFMLFMHKHGEGPVADKIYRHHCIMATSGVIAMIAKVFDDSRLFDARTSGYVWTVLMMFIGAMLLIYTE